MIFMFFGCVAERWQLKPKSLGSTPGGTTFLSFPLPLRRSSDGNGIDWLWSDYISLSGLQTVGESHPSDSSCCDFAHYLSQSCSMLCILQPPNQIGPPLPIPTSPLFPLSPLVLASEASSCEHFSEDWPHGHQLSQQQAHERTTDSASRHSVKKTHLNDVLEGLALASNITTDKYNY